MKKILNLIDKIGDFSDKWDNLFSRVMYISTGILFILWSMPFCSSTSSSFRMVSLNYLARWCMTIFGFVSIAYGLFKNNFKSDNSQGLICPVCEKSFSPGIFRTPKNKLCPNCKIKLEPIEGFYDRHPELKEDTNEKSKQK